MAMLAIWLSLLAQLVLPVARASDQRSLPTRFNNVTWDNVAWVIHNTIPDPGHYQSRPALSNGYIGIALASLGPFFETDVPVDGNNINGWPLFDRRQTFSTVAGFFDVQNDTKASNFDWLLQLGGESVISGIPHWSALHVESNGHTLTADTDLAEISNFQSSLDLKRAVVCWNYTWTPPGGSALQLDYSMLVHRLYVNRAAVQLSITSQSDAIVKVLDVLNGEGSLRTQDPEIGSDPDQPTIWSSVKPHWIPNVTAFIYSTMAWSQETDAGERQVIDEAALLGGNASSIAQSVSVKLTAGRAALVQKFVGIASHDAFDDPKRIAQDASHDGQKKGFDSMLDSHVKEWQSEFIESKVDSFAAPDGSISDDPDIIDAQILAVSNPFQLLQNVVSNNAVKEAGDNEKLSLHSISVCGLQSECYAGLVFWDVEVFMQPGLVVSFPEAGRQIANYRAQLYQQAKENVKTNFITSQANRTFNPDSAAFPWTSGRFGNCTGTGPCFDYEYHLNGDIALEFDNYLYTSGDTKLFKDRYFPIYNSVAQFYLDLLEYNSTLKAYTLKNATDPDEFANHVDNAAYTMALIDQIVNTTNAFREEYGMAQLGTVKTPVYLPTDNDAHIILEYSGMNGSIEVKQADVVLIDDFLEYPNPYTLSDLDFYAGHQSLDGPGMTFGIFSGIASNSLPYGCADYTYFLYSSQPYLRGPWYQFSEQISDNSSSNGGFNPAYPFLTGVGGNHRVPVFGFLGLKLRNDTLHISPSLPPQIPQLRYRTIYWQGHPIHAYSNISHTTLTRGAVNESLSTAHEQYSNGSIPVTVASGPEVYQLSREMPLTIENQRPDLQTAVEGNFAQCKAVTANVTNVPGQIPMAAVDGAVSTAWQPTLANETATLVVDTGAEGNALITGFMFDWAHQPPTKFSVSFANSTGTTSDDARVAWTADSVEVSNPYVAEKASDVTAYVSNTTRVELPSPIWGGRYVMLSVTGNQDSDQPGVVGPSVAEFSVMKTMSKADSATGIKSARSATKGWEKKELTREL